MTTGTQDSIEVHWQAMGSIRAVEEVLGWAGSWDTSIYSNWKHSSTRAYFLTGNAAYEGFCARNAW